MMNGVHAFHQAGLTHRDLKLDNILFDANFVPKIADLGFTRDIQGDYKTGYLYSNGVGTDGYRAPELLYGQKQVGSELDIYAMGIVLFQMRAKMLPFREAFETDRHYAMTMAENKDAFLSSFNDVLPANHFSDNFKDLFLSMVRRNPDQRPKV